VKTNFLRALAYHFVRTRPDQTYRFSARAAFEHEQELNGRECLPLVSTCSEDGPLTFRLQVVQETGAALVCERARKKFVFTRHINKEHPSFDTLEANFRRGGRDVYEVDAPGRSKPRRIRRDFGETERGAEEGPEKAEKGIESGRKADHGVDG